MSRRILLGILSIAVLTAIIGVGTYALFSDTATSTGNEFVAGTMNLQVDGQETMSTMTFSDVYPTWTGSKSYVLHNEGNIDGTWTFEANNLVEDGGSYPSAEQAVQGPGIGDLGGAVAITIKVDGVEVWTGTLAALASAGPLTFTGNNALAAGGDATVTFEAAVPGTVGNEIMGDIATFDAAFALTSTPRTGP